RPGPGRSRPQPGPRPADRDRSPTRCRGASRRPHRPPQPPPLPERARHPRGEGPMTDPSTTPTPSHRASAEAVAPRTMSEQEATAAAARVLDAVETAVVGKRQPLELVLTGILAGGHVLLEDLPGLGKTLAARSFAQALGLEFTRAQFTPDLLPADLTGAEVFDQRTGEFVFRPGPVFTGLLLADEINRTPPKTQSALLEAMQERQVSVEGTTRRLP